MVSDNLVKPFKSELESSEERILQEVKNELKTERKRIIASIEKRIEDSDTAIIEKISTLDEVLTAMSEELGGLTAGFSAYVVTYEVDDKLIKTALAVGFAGVGTSINFLTETVVAKALINTRSYNKNINAKEKQLEKFTSEKIKEEQNYWDTKIAILPKTIAYEASLVIVGEPYSRYDSISCYYLTLIFIFYEENPTLKPRRVQIKLRLKEKTEDLTTQRIEEIKAKVNKLSNLTFMADNTRANYVSADKRMKTTIYCEDVKNAKYILDKTLNAISDKFDETLLSTTTNGTNRPNLAKRKHPLANVDLNSINYNTSFKVKLHHANFLINGLRETIPIW